MSDVPMRLEALLDDERNALVQGEIDRIAAITMAKSDLLESLPRQGLRRETLERILQKAQRNRDLLEAAEKGTRAARFRLEQLFAVQTSLTTYDAAGTRTEVPARKPSFAKRA